MSYYNQDTPPPGYVPSKWEQCDTRCIICMRVLDAHIMVDNTRMIGGIDQLVDFHINNGVTIVCTDCQRNKLKFKLGKLPKVDMK